MSIDRSLKVKGALERHRNVLSRAERIERLKDEESWSEGDSPYGLPKVVNRKIQAAKKGKEKASEESEAKAESQAEAAEPEEQKS